MPVLTNLLSIILIFKKKKKKKKKKNQGKQCMIVVDI